MLTSVASLGGPVSPRAAVIVGTSLVEEAEDAIVALQACDPDGRNPTTHPSALGGDSGAARGLAAIISPFAAAVDAPSCSGPQSPMGPAPLPQPPTLEQSADMELIHPDTASNWKNFLDWENAIFEKSFEEVTKSSELTGDATHSVRCQSQRQGSREGCGPASQGFCIGVLLYCDILKADLLLLSDFACPRLKRLAAENLHRWW